MRRHTGHPSWSPSLGFTNRDDFTADRATRCPKEDSYRCHAAIWCGGTESNRHFHDARDVLPLHYNHMRPVCPGVKRPVSALPHSCRMMLRPRFVVECAGAGRPLCPGPGAAGWNRTTSHTGRILSISPVAAFCRIWHRHASRMSVLFNCPRGGARRACW